MKKNNVKFIIVNAISISSGGGLLVLKSFLDEINSDDKQDYQFIVFIQDILELSSSNNVKFIKVKKNYRYEEPALLENEEYKSTLELTRQMVRKQPYITNVKTSHDLICYLFHYCHVSSKTKHDILSKMLGHFGDLYLWK